MPRGARPTTPPTAASLDKAALDYLARYSASTEGLRRVLMRRVERAARTGVMERAEGKALVEATVERCRRGGAVDDARFAEARARRLAERGMARAAIARALAAKGVARAEIAQALDRLGAETPEPDLAAALTFARRKRLGPFRAAASRAAHRDKDLAALGRAGFAYEIARRIVAAESVAAIEVEFAALTTPPRPRPA